MYPVLNLNTVMFHQAYRFLFVLALIFLFLSCDKENEDPEDPVLYLVDTAGYTTGNDPVTPGALMTFMVEMQAGTDPLTNFYITVSGANGEAIRYFDTAFYIERLTWTGTFYKSPETVENWNFVVHDRQGGEARSSITLHADTGSVYGPVLTFPDISMGAQNGPSGCCYSLSSQEVYSIEKGKQNQDIVDLVYYFGEDERTIASPGANIEDGIFPESLTPKNWEIRNTTRYIKTALDPSYFEGVKTDSIFIALYIEADGKRKAKNLAPGDVYVFRNQEQRLGMLLVNQAEGAEQGLVNIDVKIQNPGK